MVLEEVDSTNAEAARRARDAQAPTWILARRQTAGRGRRGRVWAATPGNFAATLLIPSPAADAGALALRSYVMALALADALDAAVGCGPELALKWPNDVLLRGGKLAGILLESAGAGGAPDYLAIGVGVNLVWAPPLGALEPGAWPPVALREVAVPPGPEAFLAFLAPAFARREAVMQAQGFGPIRRDWLARAARLGETVVARMAGETVEGIFETVDEDGALVLSTARGRRRIAAADIQF